VLVESWVCSGLDGDDASDGVKKKKAGDDGVKILKKKKKARCPGRED
jgi:hypothetical protein